MLTDLLYLMNCADPLFTTKAVQEGRSTSHRWLRNESRGSAHEEVHAVILHYFGDLQMLADLEITVPSARSFALRSIARHTIGVTKEAASDFKQADELKTEEDVVVALAEATLHSSPSSAERAMNKYQDYIHYLLEDSAALTGTQHHFHPYELELLAELAVSPMAVSGQTSLLLAYFGYTRARELRYGRVAACNAMALGSVYAQQGRLEQAQILLQAGLDFTRNIDNTHLEAKLNQCIADVYLANGDVKGALGLYVRVHRESLRNKDVWQRMSAQSKLAVAHALLDNREQVNDFTWDYLDQAGAYFSERHSDLDALAKSNALINNRELTERVLKLMRQSAPDNWYVLTQTALTECLLDIRNSDFGAATERARQATMHCQVYGIPELEIPSLVYLLYLHLLQYRATGILGYLSEAAAAAADLGDVLRARPGKSSLRDMATGVHQLIRHELADDPSRLAEPLAGYRLWETLSPAKELLEQIVSNPWQVHARSLVTSRPGAVVAVLATKEGEIRETIGTAPAGLQEIHLTGLASAIKGLELDQIRSRQTVVSVAFGAHTILVEAVSESILVLLVKRDTFLLHRKFTEAAESLRSKTSPDEGVDLGMFVETLKGLFEFADGH